VKHGQDGRLHSVGAFQFGQKEEMAKGWSRFGPEDLADLLQIRLNGLVESLPVPESNFPNYLRTRIISF